MNEKLVHPDWDFQISLSDGSSTILVLEKQTLFRSTVVGIMNQCRGEIGDYVFSDDKKQFDLQDRMIVVSDPLNADPSNKRVSNAISQQIKDIIVSSDFYKEANDLVNHIERFADSIEETHRLNLAHQEYEISSLHKILNLQLQVEYENELERIMEFMNVSHDVCGIDCFTFVSLLSFFTPEEINTLVNEATSNKHNLLLLEGYEPDYVPVLTRKIIIDKDDCQIF